MKEKINRIVSESEEQFLKEYRQEKYEKPSVAADIVIFTVTEGERVSYRRLPEKELRILLIRRGGHPFKDYWALPGGFVQSDETVESAAQRELSEETGVRCDYLEQLYTFSTPGRDPRTWVMSCAHMALIDSDKIDIRAGDDAADAAWFKLAAREMKGKTILSLTRGGLEIKAELKRAGRPPDYEIINNTGLAFDHAKIILYALERLRYKLEYTSVAFHLLPGQFTLTELQQIYEVVLGKQLLAPAFRRKMTPLVEETDIFEGETGHRPSRLYRKKSDINEKDS
ncbi:ADP-ribose pyrophosphatase [Clostridia bacterium]|nr:ADP-ribose pyrophosphatase [Clostridia bacterium]